MKLSLALSLLFKPSLFGKIRRSQESNGTSSYVKSYKDLMKNSRPTSDFIDAEMLTFAWETDPEVIARLLPPPLKPTSRPLAAGFIAYYPKTNFSAPYHECGLFLRASYKGEEGYYCLAMPVTDDMAMAGGREAWGYPKKMANIVMSREGDTLSGYAERHGIKFLQVKATLTGKVNNDNAGLNVMRATGINPDGEFSDKVFLFKHSPSPDPRKIFDYPPLLVEGVTRFRPKTFKWAEMDVELTPSAFDPWSEVPVKRMLGGFYTVGDNSMLHGRVLKKINQLEFLPYAFVKWEFDQFWG